MQKNRGLHKHYQTADRLMLKISCGLFVASLGVAFLYDTWFEAIFIGGTVLAGLVTFSVLAPGSIWSRIATGMGFMFFTALHIHQTQGMLEAHFGVFVLLAILLFYRDWVPIVAAAGTIAVHHVAFFLLQASGSSIWLLPTMENGLWIVALHALYVVVESALLILMAHKQKLEYVQASELLEATSDIVRDEKLDLTIRTSGETDLLGKFDQYTQSVAMLSQTVKFTAESIQEDGSTLQQATQKMLEITDRQASESQNISLNIDQLSQLIAEVNRCASEVADNVQAADERATKSEEESQESRRVIEALATQIATAKDIIEALNERSSAISSVMDVIRNIADQTNLLALNAAIEAARAGEQGRGFAVVADEVRTLAQRTQDSTADIDKMVDALQSGSASSVQAIVTSEAHVAECLEKTESAQLLMTDIRNDVASLNELSISIKRQTEQQLAAVKEINTWTDQLELDSVEAVEGSRTVAESGKNVQILATTLSTETARFKLD